jgi:hypothetical protein
MTEKSKKILKRPEKTQTFVWEPVEGFNLEPRFFTWNLCRHKTVLVQKGMWSSQIQIPDGRPTEFFFR